MEEKRTLLPCIHSLQKKKKNASQCVMMRTTMPVSTRGISTRSSNSRRIISYAVCSQYAHGSHCGIAYCICVCTFFAGTFVSSMLLQFNTIEWKSINKQCTQEKETERMADPKRGSTYYYRLHEKDQQIKLYGKSKIDT